jgi:heme/copper-type cytochrome/quinol oxidase subunit 1
MTRKLPFFVWTILWTSVQILIAIPLDGGAGNGAARPPPRSTFQSANGSSSCLWQHLFWFFGHPEVYILIRRRSA